MIEDFEIKEINSIDFLKKFKNNTYTCFSGGKDSLVVLDLAIKSGINNVIFCDTTMEFQETLDYIKKIENHYDIKVEIVSAPIPFFDLVHKIGFPSRTMRWCCKTYKFSPLAIFARKKKVRSYITGLRSEEHIRRKQYSKIDENYLINAKQINPILNWSSQEIWAYIQKYNLPFNPLYDLGFKRIGCWPCPFKSKKEWSLIKKYFPDKSNMLKNILRIVLKDCEGIGIKNLDDFISNYKWTGYTRPQNSELKGKIEFLDGITFIHLENTTQLQKIKNVIPILSLDYKIIRNSVMIEKKLRKQSVKILVEKALNCIGCGTCVAFCDSLSIKDNHLIVDTTSCKSCLKCVKTNLMRGACIMRNFSPFRIEIATCQNLNVENSINDNSPQNLKSRVGLIRTRTPLENLIDKFKNYAEIKKYAQYISIKNRKLEAIAYKSRGFVEIKIYPRNNELEEVMNDIRKVIS